MNMARFVRVHDQLRGDGPRWSFNPSSKLLETVVPLTWTGVRPYTIGKATLRVLRRWEQVGSDGHKKTLRRLGATRGHPSNNRDVCPENAKELLVGFTGDLITDEVVEGYLAPVSSCSVFEPETIALMTRPINPLTQTSLGYNALWWSPDPSEIVSEGPEGVVGQWMGPNGPELYDCEHILDPDCEIVLRLARDAGFDPRRLGANHFAIALERGRGGVQSELLRVVDSFDIPLGTNPVSVQVPKPAPAAIQAVLQGQTTKTRDVAWEVGTDRDLPIIDGPAWDGDAAAESVFAWAGWPDAPDPDKARRAFLVYDADAAELKGSYKLPIARYDDGRLEVLVSGLQAAASYLPQTDIPADVAERARAVLDGYQAKREQPQERDVAPVRDGVSIYTPGRYKPRTNTMPDTTIVEQITLGIGRDNEAKLRKRGIAVPTPHVVRVVDMDAEKIRGAIESMQETLANVLVMLGETEEKMADATEQGQENEKLGTELSDLKAKVAGLEDMLKKTGDALGLANVADLENAVNKLRTERDSLLDEVEPLRRDAFARARDVAEKIGVDKTQLDNAKNIQDVRRLAAVHKYGEPRFGKATDGEIAGAFVAIELQVADAAATTPNPANPGSPAPTPTNDGANNQQKPPGSFNMPEPALPTRDSNGNQPAAPADTSKTIKNNLRALG